MPVNDIAKISNEELKLSDVPTYGAAWSDITKFAQTYMAYKHHGGNHPVAEIANGKARSPEQCSLSELRAAVFFEYRRQNHFGEPPNVEKMKHIHDLTGQIRLRVVEKERTSK